MKSVIYVDVLIFQNLFMNYLLLYTISRFFKLKAKWWRLAAASLIGAFYVIVIFFPELHALYSVLMKLLVSFIMIIVAFSPYKIRDFIKITIIFYIEAFLIGGVLIGVFYLNYGFVDAVNGVFSINHVTANYIVVGSMAALLLVKVGFDFFENYYSGEKNRIKLQIILGNSTCDVNALIDTGNSLRDPLTNEPVIVVYFKHIEGLFPEEVKGLGNVWEDGTSMYNRIITSPLKNRLRLIPFKALGVENGMLMGVKVDTVVVQHRGKARIISSPVIAIYGKPLTTEGDYEALAYPGII